MPQQSSSLIFPHRLNHKSQYTVLGHMYVGSYFSLVYFFGVNLNGCFVRSVLIVVTYILVWFMVLSLRHCNCKSNQTAMCCVSLDYPTNGQCVVSCVLGVVCVVLVV